MARIRSAFSAIAFIICAAAPILLMLAAIIDTASRAGH